MGLLSFLQRATGATAAVGADADGVALARRRARRRLVGATVLVVIGVVGFPLLFDTAPRPLPIDIPIEIPAKNAVPPLVAKPAAAPAKKEPVVTESADPAIRDVPASMAESKSVEKAIDKPAPKPAPSKPTAPAPRAATSDNAAEATRAKAALEGKTPAPAEAATRFVVQVGAYSEPDSARDARARVEKLGFKTYTQVVDTAAGKRIRVRLGPYAERGEAEKIAVQLKQAGLPSAVLTL